MIWGEGSREYAPGSPRTTADRTSGFVKVKGCESRVAAGMDAASFGDEYLQPGAPRLWDCFCCTPQLTRAALLLGSSSNTLLFQHRQCRMLASGPWWSTTTSQQQSCTKRQAAS